MFIINIESISSWDLYITGYKAGHKPCWFSGLAWMPSYTSAQCCSSSFMHVMYANSV